MYDCIVIGGGPSGMMCAIYLKRAGKNVLILEKSMIGGQVGLTTNIENFPGIKQINGADLALNMYEQVKNMGIEIKFEEVVETNLKCEEKIVKTLKNEYTAKTIYIATGAVNKSLDVENEKNFVNKGISYCATCDGMLYKNKDVAVVGAGNVALQDCLYLSNIVNKIYLIHRRDEFRGDFVTIQKIEDLKNSEKIEYVLSSEITKLVGNDKLEKIEVLNKKTNATKEIKIDCLFVAIGRKPDTEIFDGLTLDEKGYIVVNDKMETNISGVFAGGDVRNTNLRQIVTACADGAVASVEISKFCSK